MSTPLLLAPLLVPTPLLLAPPVLLAPVLVPTPLLLAPPVLLAPVLVPTPLLVSTPLLLAPLLVPTPLLLTRLLVGWFMLKWWMSRRYRMRLCGCGLGCWVVPSRLWRR